uniref:Uncharacterized protein n=1 Tax=Cucumis melo TaxID=3656 RepID=A0A9I9EII9_CUCME
MEKVEDVWLHQKLLSLAKDPKNCPVYHIRFLEKKKKSLHHVKPFGLGGAREFLKIDMRMLKIVVILIHISTKSDGNDDHIFLDSILLSGSSNEAPDRRLPLSHKRRDHFMLPRLIGTLVMHTSFVVCDAKR